MRVIPIVFTAVVLIGCASSPPTAQQLAAMSDDELCDAVDSWPLRYDVATSMLSRGLECHPAQKACKIAGYSPDQQQYDDCIAAMIQQIHQDEARAAEARAIWAGAVMQGGQSMQNALSGNRETCIASPDYGGGSTITCY
jgi:hypothetical protein